MHLLEYIRCFYNTEHWQNIDEFYVSDNTNFMVVMKSGMKVTFGSIDSTEGLLRKIKMMTKIFEQVEQSERSYLDLTTDKGYYGEYSWAEMEEMKRKALGIEEEEEPEEEETDSEEEDTTDEDDSSEKTEKSEKSEKSEKPKKSEKSEKPSSDDEKEKESSKKSEKPKASAKPSASADPRKKESADAKETESAENESEKSDDSSEKSEDNTASDDEE